MPVNSIVGHAMLVTGGASGIGRAVVDAYVVNGADVTVLDRSREGTDALLRDYDGKVRCIVGDATDAEVVQQAVDVASSGGKELHNLTCCVGVFDFYASLREMPATDLMNAAEEIWRINVLSSLLAANLAFPVLRTSSSASITFTLSGSAFFPDGGGVLYGSSKWALRGIVSHLAKDFAPEVRVNGVAPGGTGKTGLAGLQSLKQYQTVAMATGRDERISEACLLRTVATPEDHAGSYVYLADPTTSRVVTGTVVNSDGGHL